MRFKNIKKNKKIREKERENTCEEIKRTRGKRAKPQKGKGNKRTRGPPAAWEENTRDEKVKNPPAAWEMKRMCVEL